MNIDFVSYLWTGLLHELDSCELIVCSQLIQCAFVRSIHIQTMHSSAWIHLLHQDAVGTVNVTQFSMSDQRSMISTDWVEVKLHKHMKSGNPVHQSSPAIQSTVTMHSNNPVHNRQSTIQSSDSETQPLHRQLFIQLQILCNQGYRCLISMWPRVVLAPPPSNSYFCSAASACGHR